VRVWTKSACVVLAWSCLIVVVAAGMKESVRPAQANIRIASGTTQVTLASTLTVAAARRAAARPAGRYVVQPGDTLSGIAARLAVRGGWPALYAANRPRIGPDPDLIRPGTVLVLPGRMAPARYRVVPGDTLSGIAAGLAVPGGWPALYAANRAVIGPDPDVIRPGTVLTVPRPAAPPPAASGPGRHHPAPRPAGSVPARAGAPPGTPQWLEALLLAVGLVIGAALLAWAVLTVAAARRAAARPAGRYVVQRGDTLSGIAARLAVRGGWPALYAANRPRIGPDPDVIRPGTVLVLPGRMAPGRYRAAPVGTPAGSSPGPGYGQVAAEKAGIVLADHDRVVVTRSTRDGAVHVLRPPGEDPAVILRAARLVLPEDLYRELAERLGMPGA